MNRKLNSSHGVYVIYPLIALVAILNSCVPDDGEVSSTDLTERMPFSVEDYAQLTPEELVDKFGLRESELPVRDMPGWSPLQKVVVEMPGNEPWEGRFERLNFLQSIAPEVEFVPVKNLTDAIERGVLEDAQATIGLGCGPATIEAIGPQVHWIQSGSVGLDRCFNTVGEDAQRMQEKMKEQNVLVSSIRDMTKHSIAQHSLTIMLSLIGGMDIHAERQRKHIWGRTRTDVVRDKHLDAEFQDLTLFVVGLGRIGCLLYTSPSHRD